MTWCRSHRIEESGNRRHTRSQGPVRCLLRVQGTTLEYKQRTAVSQEEEIGNSDKSYWCKLGTGPQWLLLSSAYTLA